MDSSDSDCFESADEDFDYDSDDEDTKSKQHKNNKIIQPELCKLKLEEQEDQEVVADVENVPGEALPHSEETSKNVIVVDSNVCDIESKTVTVTVKEENVDRTKNVKVLIDEKKMESTSDSSSAEECKTDTEKNKTRILESSVPNNDISKIEFDTQVFKVNTEPPEKSLVIVRDTENKEKESVDDNLWDDDELDWGSEGAKELQTVDTPQSNNEDSGWGDFDADWETPTPSARKEGNNKTEQIADDFGDWESLDKPEEKMKPGETTESSWGGWGSWGVTSILNTATQGVSTLSNHVSQGLSAVLEGGIGIPEPEELAKLNTSKENNSVQTPPAEDPAIPVAFGLGNLVTGVSHLTKFVESTGNKVIAGSLDTLEAIGKKTVEVLQEGDPGLKKKRAFLKLEPEKPNLSQILREAKEENQIQESISTKKLVNYESLFDDHQGLVHLEALEMLSKVCSIKLDHLNKTLTGDALKDMQETLDQVKELCELLDDEEEGTKLSLPVAETTIDNAMKEINIAITYRKLFETCRATDTWLNNISSSFTDDVELHQKAIESLAQITAIAMEQFHKTGELLMVKEHRSTADEADSLTQITNTLKSLILTEANKFVDKFGQITATNKEKVNEQITNIFYEAANSGTYIQTAFHLLIPVLQVGAI